MVKETVVIGAGMAGIAAARTLQDHGWAVRILEGRDRIGGRTHTDYSLGTAIDFGGSWIHGPYGNPLTPLAKQFGVATGYTDFVDASGGAVMAFDADGTVLDAVEYAQGLQLAQGVMTHAYGSALYQLPEREYRSLNALHEFGLPIPKGITPTQRKGYDYAALIRSEFNNAADLAEIDWRIGEDYVGLPGGDQMLYSGGFGTIAAGLADGLTIETGVSVSAIRYGNESDNGGVTLETNQGNYACQRVIVTVPLSVLQSRWIHFAPALPPEKQAAMARIGFGHYEKLALRFPDFFWPKDKQRFNYLTDHTSGFYTSWLNHGYYSGEPILVNYHAASRAKQTNQMSDDELIAGAMSVLTRLFGNGVVGAIPEPIGYARTGWQADPFSGGSYSFNKVGQQPCDRRILGDPVGEQLYFAGEATHCHYYATVHGAYESGIRAAQEIMVGR